MYTSEEEGEEQLTRGENLLVVMPFVTPEASEVDPIDFNVEPLLVVSEPEPNRGVPPAGYLTDELGRASNGASHTEVEESSPEEFVRAQLDPNAQLKLNRMIGNSFRPERGRHPGVRNRTDDENGGVAVVGMLTGGATAGRLFGMDPSVVAHRTRAATSQQMLERGEHKPSLKAKIEELSGSVVDRAFGVISEALDNITPEKVRGEKVTNLTRIARDMSGLIKDVTPREVAEGPGVHFHIWRPDLAAESDYGDVINVRTIEEKK